MNKKYSVLTDEELIVYFKNHDGVAASLLYARYESYIHRLSQARFVKCFAEDLEQELWLRFFESIAVYDPCRGIPFRKMVSSLLYHTRWNLFKQHQKRWERELSNDEYMDYLADVDVYAKLDEPTIPALLESLSLSAQQQEVLLWMMEHEHCTMRDVATHFSISHQRVHRIIQAIRKKVELFLAQKGDK